MAPLLAPILSAQVTASGGSEVPDEVFRTRHDTNVWVTQDKRVYKITEMDTNHLVHAIIFMEARAEMLKENHRTLPGITSARVKVMLKEAKKRGLMPRICITMGDVRGAVLETREINSRITISPDSDDY